MSAPMQKPKLEDEYLPNSSSAIESVPISSRSTQLSIMSTNGNSMNTADNIDFNEMAQGFPVQPRNLQELLNVSSMLQSIPGQEVSGPITQNEEREKFLRGALSHLSVNVVDEMKKQIGILTEIVNGYPINDIERYVTTFDTIDDLICHIDNANVFYQIGGLNIINLLLRHPLDVIHWRAAGVIAGCCQNNPFCKSLSVTDEVFCPLMELATNYLDSHGQFKAIGALSAIVRDNPEGVKQFRKYRGINMVEQALNTGNEKVILRACYLIKALCHTDNTIKDELLETTIITSLISLIRGPETIIVDQILGTLLEIIRDHENAALACLRDDWGFYAHVKELIKSKNFDVPQEEYAAIAKEIFLVMNSHETKKKARIEKNKINENKYYLPDESHERKRKNK